MPIEVPCERCRKTFSVPDERAGQRGRCTCGAIFPIIGDLAEIGVDILNPIQPLAKGMEPDKLKAAYGDIISFHGGIDVQHLLPFGTPEEVRDEVVKYIEALAPGGGYVLAVSHNIQADVPVENILALFDAAWEYGHQPGRALFLGP